MAVNPVELFTKFECANSLIDFSKQPVSEDSSYESMTASQKKASTAWNEYDTNKLYEAVKSYGEGPISWIAISKEASFIEHRTPAQCLRRWTYIKDLNPNKLLYRWEKSEIASLKRATKTRSNPIDWDQVAKEVKRNRAACKTQYMRLKKARKL